MQTTKIAILVRDDLAAWQRLNVTAFLMSGLTAATPSIIGEPYRNAAGQTFLAMAVQPIVVLAGDLATLRAAHGRAIAQGVMHAAYVEEMFATSNDVDNRAAFARTGPEEANLVGLALRAERKTVDKITKGAVRHR